VVSEHFPWADIVGKYFLFLQIFFFSEKKKEGRDILEVFSIFYEKFAENGCISEFPLRKTPKLKKKNHPKRGPGSQDIEVLKSANRVFFADGGAICFYFCSSWRPNFLTDLSSSHNFTQFQKKNQPKRSPGSEVMSILTSTVF
jgi:hypothetical protein